MLHTFFISNTEIDKKYAKAKQHTEAEIRWKMVKKMSFCNREHLSSIGDSINKTLTNKEGVFFVWI